MQIKTTKFVFAIASIAFYSGCMSTPPPQKIALEYPRESDRINEKNILEVSPSNLYKAKEILAGHDFVEINPSKLRELITSSGFINSGKIYLVRSTKDDMAGKYSAFFRGGHLILLYNHFGACSASLSGAIIITTPGDLKTVSGGCSGAL
ncbi:hypothetical protein [Xanthomonas bonasiae]|uniref:hypothetical protein n=1 Tax=Xanthomonas bonasiae TaxID=2810351 RepID=UPI0017802420|nr:hypothetical protein [Xanthomonas surreyensis]MBD7924259.1 hypothetical protein [Xanthomonas surreyensis]